MHSTTAPTLMAAALALAATLAPAQATKPAAAPASAPASMPATAASGAVADSAEKAMPLAAGAPIPASASPLLDAEGNEVDLAAMAAGKPTVVVFYRGGWCPYCTTQLADLARVHPQLEAAGVQLVGISPDSPESIKAMLAEGPLPYTLLSDSSHRAIKAFGVAFAVDAPGLDFLKGHGIDLAAASGNAEPVLPVPAVFVFDKAGKVTFVHANPDYKERLKGEVVLAAAGVKPAPASQPASAPAK